MVTKLSIPDFRLPLSLLDSTPRSALVDLELRAVNPSLVLLQSTGDVGFPVPVAARVIPVTNGAPAGDSSPLSTHFLLPFGLLFGFGFVLLLLRLSSLLVMVIT